MAVRRIKTDHVRDHILSDRAVPCPNARDYDRQSTYGVKAKTGMWVTYNDGDSAVRYGRVLGRVDADGSDDVERIDGHLSVLVLADNHQHAYIRWIDPTDVLEVGTTLPSKLLAWMTGPMPTADIVHKLSAYGTLSERYADKIAHHVEAFEQGMSPIAYDLRKALK